MMTFELKTSLGPVSQRHRATGGKCARCVTNAIARELFRMTALTPCLAFIVLFTCELSAKAIFPDGGVSPDPENDRIMSAWRRREAAVESYRFEWREEHMIARGALGPPIQAPQDEDAETTPEKDVMISSEHGVILAASQGRLWRTGDDWSPESSRATKQDRVLVCRRADQIDLFTGGDAKCPLATITEGSSLSNILAWHGGIPMALCYRVLHSDFRAFDTHLFTIENVSNARREPLVVATFPHGKGRISLWLDPLRDYISTRQVFIDERGKTGDSLEISYVPDKTAGYAPSSWTETIYDSNGVPLHTFNSVVTRYEINPALSDDAFDLVLPPGTWVNDLERRITYILLPGGDQYVIKDGEGVDDYEDIIRSASRRKYLFGATVAIVGLAAAALVYRLAKRKMNKM